MSKKKNEHFSGNLNIPNLINRLLAIYDDTNWNLYIRKVVYNNPATIVFWSDNTKTISKCHGEDIYDWRVGLLTAVLKKFGITKTSKLIEEWKPLTENGELIQANNIVDVAEVRKRNRNIV